VYGSCLGCCLCPISKKKRGKLILPLSEGKPVPRFKPRGFKLNLATLDEPFVTRANCISLLHPLLYSEVTQFPLNWSCHKQNIADRCLPSLPPAGPEGLVPASVTTSKGWWMVCYLPCCKEPLAGREGNGVRAFPCCWQGRISERKRFVSSLVLGESVEMTDLGSSWGQELFLSKERVF